MHPVTFFTAGIFSVIESCKFSSSACVDDIDSKLLNNTRHASAHYLAWLFSPSLSLCAVPENWKAGKVVPIYKSGDKDSPLNYRLILLTSVSCKIMEHGIYSQIIQFLDSNDFFKSSQNIFRSNYLAKPTLPFSFMLCVLILTTAYKLTPFY